MKDVLTKMDSMFAKIDSKFEHMEGRFEHIEGKISTVYWVVGLSTALIAIFIALK